MEYLGILNTTKEFYSIPRNPKEYSVFRKNTEGSNGIRNPKQYLNTNGIRNPNEGSNGIRNARNVKEY